MIGGHVTVERRVVFSFFDCRNVPSPDCRLVLLLMYSRNVVKNTLLVIVVGRACISYALHVHHAPLYTYSAYVCVVCTYESRTHIWRGGTKYRGVGEFG
jgi:hypothetical protein